MPSGRASSSLSRAQAAAVGLAPPVVMPAESAPRRSRAGKMKLQSAGSSTTFTGRPRSRHSSETQRLSSLSPVADMTSDAPSRSDSRKPRRVSRKRPSSSRSRQNFGATSLTSAPYSARLSALRFATLPPPTIRISRPSSSTNSGNRAMSAPPMQSNIASRREFPRAAVPLRTPAPQRRRRRCPQARPGRRASHPPGWRAGPRAS